MVAVPDVVRKRRQAVGRRLSELRRERALSQEALAHAAGLDRSFYVEVETAKHSISLDRLFDIAEALDLHLSQMFANVEQF